MDSNFTPTSVAAANALALQWTSAFIILRADKLAIGTKFTT